MSATSGPLGDHMEAAYIDDDDMNVGPKGERLDDAEQVGEATKTEQAAEEVEPEVQKIEEVEKVGEEAKA